MWLKQIEWKSGGHGNYRGAKDITTVFRLSDLKDGAAIY
jgi:hypothetical protein